jgi:hypothetical protein
MKQSSADFLYEVREACRCRTDGGETEVTPSNSRVSPRDCISLRTLRIIMYDRIQLMYDVR